MGAICKCNGLDWPTKPPSTLWKDWLTSLYSLDPFVGYYLGFWGGDDHSLHLHSPSSLFSVAGALSQMGSFFGYQFRPKAQYVMQSVFGETIFPLIGQTNTEKGTWLFGTTDGGNLVLLKAGESTSPKLVKFGFEYAGGEWHDTPWQLVKGGDGKFYNVIVSVPSGGKMIKKTSSW